MAEIKGVKRIKTTDDNGNEVVKTVNQQIDELLEVVNIPSFAVKPGMVVGVREKSKSLEVINITVLQLSVSLHIAGKVEVVIHRRRYFTARSIN